MYPTSDGLLNKFDISFYITIFSYSFLYIKFGKGLPFVIPSVLFKDLKLLPSHCNGLIAYVI